MRLTEREMWREKDEVGAERETCGQRKREREGKEREKRKKRWICR